MPRVYAGGGTPFYPITDEEFTDSNKWWTWVEHITSSGDEGISEIVNGVWRGKAKDVDGDTWATVGATQGDRPHGHYNPKASAKLKTTLLMGRESDSTVEIKFRRTISTPILYNPNVNPTQSLKSICSMGVTFWFKVHHIGETWNYHDPDPWGERNCIVLDLFVDRWEWTFAWIHISNEGWPNPVLHYFVGDYFPFDNDIHGVFTVEQSDYNTWRTATFDLDYYIGKIWDWMYAKEYFEPVALELMAVGPTMEAIGCEISGEIDYIKVKISKEVFFFDFEEGKEAWHEEYGSPVDSSVQWHRTSWKAYDPNPYDWYVCKSWHFGKDGENYPNNAYGYVKFPYAKLQGSTSIVSGTFLFTGDGEAKIEVMVKIDTETNYDYLYLEYRYRNYYSTSWSSGWCPLYLWHGHVDWTKYTIYLPSTLNGKIVEFRFRFYSDSSITYEGAWFDDFKIYS